MKKKTKRFLTSLPKRAGGIALSVTMVAGSLYNDSLVATAATTGNSWKSDVTTALEKLSDAEAGADQYGEASEALQESYDSLVGAKSVENLCVTAVTEDTITLEWSTFEDENLVGYNVYWADSNAATTVYKLLDADSNNCYDETKCTIDAALLDSSKESVTFEVKMSTNKNHWFRVAPVTQVGAGSKCEAVMSPTAVAYTTQLENIGRGLTVTMTQEGAYLNWRLLASELDGGYTETGLTGFDFNIYRGEELIATVTDSTNYLDKENTSELTDSTYRIVPVKDGTELSNEAVSDYDIFMEDSSGKNVAYTDIPLQKPSNTTIAETYGVDSIALGGYKMTDSGYTSADDVITYSANDMSVGDVDGDGEYEYLVQWEPSLSKDVSQQGYTGKTYIDCYELDGTLLWRLDLGINIRAGAHYTQFGLYDYDGDGKAELILKTAPGTKMTKYALDEEGKNIWEGSSLKVDSTDYVNHTASGKSQGAKDNSNYVFSADDYREYLIEVFQDWGVWSRYSSKTVEKAIDGHWSDNLVEMFSTSAQWSDSTFYTGEVASSANVTLNMNKITTGEIQKYIPDYEEGDMLVNVALRDENGNVRYVSNNTGVNPVMKTVRVEEVKDYYGGYDLTLVNRDVKDVGYTKEEATVLADYYLNHYQYRMKKHNLNTWEGYVVAGPEYITLYSGDGTELDTQDWYYEREDDGMLWGDYAMNYIEPGNRVDRFNVAVAYLDGETPSCVMGRGYYTRTTMAAYNVVDKKLQLAGAIDSGWTVMSNPFNDGPHGFDGCDEKNGRLSGQGDHYIAVADVDGDGRQDLVNGGAIVSYKNGNLYLYSSGGDYLKGGTGDSWAKYGHGDAIHITDVDPDNPGLEIVSCFEGGAYAPYNWAVRDAKSNKVLFGAPGTTDYGRIIIGDVLPDVRGLEIDPGYDAKGNKVSLTGTSNNMNIKWSANMTTQFISGTSNTTIIGNVDGKSYTFLNASGYSTNNGTKGNPGLVADIFGDSREELILRKADSSNLRIYMNTEVSEHKNYTLMHNAQYRVGIASQNSAYNQPAYTDYYYASDTDWSRVLIPNTPSDQEPGAVIVKPASVSINTTSKTLLPGETLQLKATVIPSAADQKVTWTSDKEEVAKVDANGFVTAVSNGMAYITATTANDKTVTCKVSVVGDYKDDGVDKMPIGASYTFLFGSDVNAGGTKKAVKADSTYDNQKGYGWAENSHVTLTDGKDYVEATNYRSTDAIPVYEYPTFEVDVPVGIYEVTIVQGTNGKEAAVNGAYVEGNKYSVRWSTENFATSYTEPSEDSWIWTKPGETKTTVINTAVADGKLTINLATSLTNEGISGTTYIKEITVTRKDQITIPSTKPTLRFIGDSTLAKYPPEDGGTWTPIPERTGWGEEFSMGKFMDDDVVLVNKAVAGSSAKSYIYDGYLNDFLMTSHPGDTVIIEGGINDSASGPRYSTAEEFKTTLNYIIECCEAFGLDVILSSGTSASATYTNPMKALAAEKGLHYVDLATQWTAYQSAVGTTQGNMTVDGTHLRRVGGVVAAQLVANDIADLEGLYISGHVKKTPVNYNKPTVAVNGLFAKAQTQGSVTLTWNVDENTLYDVNQLITGFNVYRKEKGTSAAPKLVATQTAYVSAGMNGPQLCTTVEMPVSGTYTFQVKCVGLTGESSAAATIDVAAFVPDARYSLQDLIEKYETQLYDASVYTVESYAAVKVALAKGSQILADTNATDEEVEKALKEVEKAIEGLKLNATELERTDFQNEELTTAPWEVSGSHKSLLSAKMESDGNRLLNLYVEAAGSRNVNKVFQNTSNVNAAVELVEFVWYPGNPDQRNVTEVEFYSADANRLLSLKTASNGHIGYVTGNYPGDSTAYMTGTGFHDYEGSKAVDLGLTNEAWYNVKLVLNYATQTADLYIEPRDDASIDGAVVKGISIDAAGSNTVTKLNFLLMRGKQDNGTSNALSILWDSYYDDYAMYYADSVTDADKADYTAALSAYEEKTKGLSSAILSGEQFILAQAVADIMTKDIGFFTAKDYDYAADVLRKAANGVPGFVKISSIKLQAESDKVTAGMTANVTAVLNEGANEELGWSSSDESIATVVGNGTKAEILAKKAGTVTIKAEGLSSGVAGEIVLHVTGEAYFFGKDMIETATYTAQKGYGFKDYTYPEGAKGWMPGISPDGDVYVPRTLVENNRVSYLNTSDSGEDYVAINGQNWTELPEGGRDEDRIPYQNTSAFVVDKENGNYEVSVTFYNPGKTAETAQVIAENIVRYAGGEHDASEIASTTIAAGQTATVTFPLALTDQQITLRFVQNVTDAGYEAAANRTVYVKSVSVDEYQSADREKTAILIAGDSTVQSYADKNYRASWAQLLYQLFGTTVENGVNDGSNKGYAVYETEDTYIVNYARDARSTKSFVEEGRFNELLLNIQQGDYVFMQFAHNDDNQARSNRFVSVADFKKNIAAYNQAIAERGGTLVLVTPIALGIWENGVLDHRLDDYRMAMMESGLPVLDLMGATLGLLSDMGEDNCNAIGIYKDKIHTYEAGAILYQRLLGNLLLASKDSRLAGVQGLMNLPVPTEGIHITVDSELMYIGDTASIHVKVGNTAISPIASYSAKDVTFMTSDKTIVDVSADGKLSAGSENGKAVITASYTTGDLTGTDCTAYADYIVIEVTDDASRIKKNPSDNSNNNPNQDKESEHGGNTENSSSSTSSGTGSVIPSMGNQSNQNQASASLGVITDEAVPLASNVDEGGTQKDSTGAYISPATYDVSWDSNATRRAKAANDTATDTPAEKETGSYNEESWKALDTAAEALALKAGFFADDSTPFDYDVILVERMTATMDALEAVKDMPLADTSEGDELYELCKEAIENKSFYTETSMELLTEAMEAYEEARKALDIRDVVKETYEVIEFWLTGVETEYEEKPYAGYFDFNTTQTGGSSYNDELTWEASGWTSVGIAKGHPELTSYDKESGYGMVAASVGRHRNTGDAVMDDFMIGGVFKVDLPAGTYDVITYTGDLNTGCKGSASYKFYTDYEDDQNTGKLIASLAKGTAPAAQILERKVTFTLKEAATVTMVAAENGYTNAVIFEQNMKAQVESYDVESLAKLVKEIDDKKLVETDYTLSTWKDFKAAYDEAKKAVKNGASFAQQIATIETRLQETYKALTLRVADGQYAIDFGPEQESDSVAAQIATNILLSGYAPDNVTLLKKNELVSGSALYKENVNDNGLHYGFTSEVASGFTATGGAYFRDWVYGKGGSAYTFKADLPSGQYLVYVYTGCKEAANTTKFYFNGGEAAIDTNNTAYTVTDGKAIYTQTSNAGGQFAAPGCIYTVQVAPNGDALGYVKDVEMGTLSLTLFDDSEGLASDAVTARLCGLGICRIGDYDPDAVVNLAAEEEEFNEEETTEEETTEEETTEEETTEEETTEEETTEEETTEEETTEEETTEEKTTEEETTEEGRTEEKSGQKDTIKEDASQTKLTEAVSEKTEQAVEKTTESTAQDQTD